MLMTESLEIGEMFGAAMRDRYGDDDLAAHFRAFDTICSATQERQDAVIALLDSHRLDLMLVVGGYNSSNTCNLARICADARADVPHRRAGVPGLGRPKSATGRSARRRPSRADEVGPTDWLPATGRLTVGLTAGASTPNNIVGQVIERLERFAG